MDIHNQVKEKVEQISESYYDLGELFYNIFETSAYEGLGYVGPGAFEKYCSLEIGYNYQSAIQRIRVFKTYKELGLTKEELAEISFSNALALVSIINHDNRDYWMNKAKTLTHKELRAEIKNLIGNLAKAEETEMDMNVEDKTKVKFNFKYVDTDADFIQKALSEADIQYECGGNYNLALKHILQDYSTVFHNKNISLDSAIAILNDRYKIKMTPQQALATRTTEAVNA
jgi:hypothetical protein